ncbi:MAG TPA: iron chelate uptake ABC transporter family permease subunit [Candidatus Limnocylindria bacterium]|jgi:iron complex transport system permease protein|nr:iron chelate uptake ABC transporter family permease subunit [Candidatus Limnocylindria bacterium]
MRATVATRPLILGPTLGRSTLVLAAGSVLLVAAAGIGLAAGTSGVAPGDALAILLHRLLGIGSVTWPASAETIVWELRLPRIVAGMVVGAGLASSGAVFQALLRNPMADPYLIGTAAGASLGAVAALLLPALLPVAVTAWLGIGAVQVLAFVGGLATVLMVFAVARGRAGTPVVTLLLAGYAVSSLLSAGVALLMFVAGDRLAAVVSWLLGSLGGASWPRLALAAPLIGVSFVLLLVRWRSLNALLLGEAQAAALGVDVEREKRRLTALAALATSAGVAISGTIGFVGLVVPHLLRLAFGPDHRLLLPASMLYGAVLLVLADTGARLAGGIPVGIVTALIGAPFFIWLLRRSLVVPRG